MCALEYIRYDNAVREEIRTNYTHITRPQDLGQVQDFHKFWVTKSSLSFHDGVIESHYQGKYDPESRTFSITNGSMYSKTGTFVFTDTSVTFIDLLKDLRTTYSVNPTTTKPTKTIQTPNNPVSNIFRVASFEDNFILVGQDCTPMLFPLYAEPRYMEIMRKYLKVDDMVEIKYVKTGRGDGSLEAINVNLGGNFKEKSKTNHADYIIGQYLSSFGRGTTPPGIGIDFIDKYEAQFYPEKGLPKIKLL